MSAHFLEKYGMTGCDIEVFILYFSDVFLIGHMSFEK